MSSVPDREPGTARPASARLLNAPVGTTLLGLSAPMLLGIAAVVLFQVVDTFYVGMLGADELAALSFTFPVGYAIVSIAMGLGLGTTAVIGRAIGQGDWGRVRRLATHALLLAVLVVTLVGGLGLLTADFIFAELLQAPARLMPLIRDYVDVYFLSIGFLVVPMVGNSAIRATGDTKTPSLIMMVSGGLNVVLDPLLIFGWGVVPGMGLFGAALATAASWLVTLLWALHVLHREQLLEWKWPRWAEVHESWRALFKIGLPAAGANLMIPVGQMLITRIVAGFGALSVAAFGVGVRIESLALIGVYAMSTALNPFVAQNFGAAQTPRVREALVFAAKYCLVLGAGTAIVLGVLGAPIAGLFSDSQVVANGAQHFLHWVPWSYGALGIAIVVPTVLNALSYANQSALLTAVRLFVFIVPASYLGAEWGGFEGLLMGLAIGNLLVGLTSWWYARRVVQRLTHEAMDTSGTLLHPDPSTPPLY